MQPDRIPESISNRDDEQKTVASACADPGRHHLYLHGPRGTGKTLVARSRLRQTDDDITTCYLSCIRADTQYRVLTQLYQSLTGDDINNGYHTAQLQDRVRDLVTGRDIVLVLDEIDFLLDHDGSDLLYFLSRLPTDANVGLITISAHHPDPRRVIDQRTLSSMQPMHVRFDPYPAEQAYDILEARLTEAEMMDVVDRDALTFLATRTRNIQLGLHWLTQATASTTDRITVDVLQDVRPAAVQRYRDDLLSGVTNHHQLLFEAISQLVTENEDKVRSGTIYDRYIHLCESTGTDALSTRRISEYITDLELLDIIDVNQYAGGTYGRTRKIQLKQYL
ncbi:MAG: AAA family ATPase [Candidatus Nanohaloarchaea archaeon]|nr:AAA family ATPase [Candidatus Nanohaloarchaea archaeon]